MQPKSVQDVDAVILHVSVQHLARPVSTARRLAISLMFAELRKLRQPSHQRNLARRSGESSRKRSFMKQKLRVPVMTSVNMSQMR